MGNREIESKKSNEWSRLEGLADQGGLRGVVDDCMMLEAWGHTPILTGSEILGWMINNKSTTPQSADDIQYLDQMLYVRNPQQLVANITEKLVRQLALGPGISQSLPVWLDVVMREYPQHVIGGVEQWAQRNTRLSLEIPAQIPGQDIWLRLWNTISTQNITQASNHGLVSSWLRAGGPPLRQEQARVLWEICSATNNMPGHMVAHVRRAALGLYTQGSELEDESVRDI